MGHTGADMRIDALAEFFKRLGDGDPVAIGFVVGFLVLLGIAGLIVLAVRRKLRLEDEAWARKRGRLPKKK